MARSKLHTTAEMVPEKRICGIVMPISDIDGCSEHHWQEVYDIISDVIENVGFDPNLVSSADEVGFINKRIIQNLYQNPIVVCDVSAKNPNVMFELGMRLAFDKPTIIVKDDKTSYTFDIGGIEHIPYPRDLRFPQVVEFKEKLGEKIIATVKAAEANTDYTTFLKHFGEFTVTKLDSKEVSGQEFILDELKALRQTITDMERSEVRAFRTLAPSAPLYGDVFLGATTSNEAARIADEISTHPRVVNTQVTQGGAHFYVRFRAKDRGSVKTLRDLFSSIYGPKKDGQTE